MTAMLRLPVRHQHPRGGDPMIRWQWVSSDAITGVRGVWTPNMTDPGVFQFQCTAVDLVTGSSLYLECSEDDVVAMLYRAGLDLAIPDHHDLYPAHPDWPPRDLLDHLTTEQSPPFLYAPQEDTIEEYGDREEAWAPGEDDDEADA